MPKFSFLTKNLVQFGLLSFWITPGSLGNEITLGELSYSIYYLFISHIKYSSNIAVSYCDQQHQKLIFGKTEYKKYIICRGQHRDNIYII